MRIGPAVISSLLALPGLVVLLGGINELTSDSEQLASLVQQLIELGQNHYQTLVSLLGLVASFFGLIGVAVILICSSLQ